MARQHLKAIFSVAVIFFLTPPSSCWTGSTISLEELQEQLQQLKTNYVQLRNIGEEKYVQLEAKIVQLQSRDQQHTDVAIRLEEKVARLEELVKIKDEQHKILEDKFYRLQYVLNNELKTEKKVAEKSVMVRTCRELRAADPTLQSEMYWIDPDGQGVGDDPIQVYCDMATGSTSVPHDSESPINVGHCADPGCYSRAINYNASQRQMKALAELSAECHQSIQYDCNYAPLQLNGVAYSWWNDREGNAQYFWAGRNSSFHTCQCGIDGNCVDPVVKCNCDATLPIPQVDNGVITDSAILPITRLNFGRTPLETSSGIHTLGRFECNGQVPVNGMSKSCQDLWRIGHTLSGLYSVMGSKVVESIYCDFTKLPSDSGFQTWIGYVDVKSSPTYFYVQRNANFIEISKPLPFDVEMLNVGGAMNMTSGIFTVPVAGRYFISFTGLMAFPGSTTIQYSRFDLYRNGKMIAQSYSDEISTAFQYETLSLQSTMNLEKGDKLWLQMVSTSTGAILSGYYSHFNGFLLEEDISQSVRMLH